MGIHCTILYTSENTKNFPNDKIFLILKSVGIDFPHGPLFYLGAY